MLQLVGAALLCVVSVASAAYPPPPPTFQAADWTTWLPTAVNGSRRANVAVSFTAPDGTADSITLIRLDLLGDSFARGFAHGSLIANEIVQFASDLEPFFDASVLSLDTSSFPAALQQQIAALIQQQGAAAGTQVFQLAADYVWATQLAFTPQNLKDEMAGVAAGVCAQLGASCDVAAWTVTIQRINMMPEIIKMACTMFGAWGSATPDGGLIQLRALDFGGGPFANNTIVFVHRNGGGDPAAQDARAFASVFFPGYVGAITGVAQSGIGISEKVWETYLPPPDDMQHGSYAGEADIFVLRDILQHARTKLEAEAYINAANRTWGMWVGVGDFATQTFDVVAYRQNSSVAYSDATIGQLTGQPFIANVAYVDRHPQPSRDGKGTLPAALSYFHGAITQAAVKTIVQTHGTGDVHWASYDFGAAGTLQLAIGKTQADGTYGPNGAGEAHNRPSLVFSLADLWQGL